MATPQAIKLLNAAKSGEKIATADRRHVIAYLQMIGEVTKGENNDHYLAAPMTNAELSQTFQVSERTIQFDRKAIREQMAEEIKAEDIALILADIRLTFTKVMLNIEKSAAKAPLGSRRYLDHQMAIAKLQTEYVKGMQDLGVYPKDLGTMHIDKFEFTAPAGLTDSGRPLNYFDRKREAPLVIDAEPVEPKALSDGANSENKPGTGTAAAAEVNPAADTPKAGQAEPPASA